MTQAGAGAGGTSRGGTGGSAMAGAAGSADPLDPPGATVLGPYSVGVSYVGGGSYSFDLSFGKDTFSEDGEAWFVAQGMLMVGERMPIKGGLLRLPKIAQLPRDYLCVGPGATYGITSAVKPDTTFGGCGLEPCTLKLVAPEPSWLACDASGTGTLKLTPSDAENAELTSQLPGLESVDLTAGTHFNPAFGNPNGATYGGKSGNQQLIIKFASKPTVPAKEWELSEITMQYRDSYFGDTQLICAAKGTYRVEGTAPELHTLEFTGVGSLQTCPGTPFGKPLVLDLADN
jgi:hypothetical protein